MTRTIVKPPPSWERLLAVGMHVAGPDAGAFLTGIWGALNDGAQGCLPYDEERELRRALLVARTQLHETKAAPSA